MNPIMMLLAMIMLPHIIRGATAQGQQKPQAGQGMPPPGAKPMGGMGHAPSTTANHNPIKGSPTAQGYAGPQSGPLGGFAGGQNMLGVLPHQQANYYMGRQFGMGMDK